MRTESICVFIDSVPPSPPLSALIWSRVRPPSHRPLHNATARVAAWEAACLRGVGPPPEPSPNVFCFAAGITGPFGTILRVGRMYDTKEQHNADSNSTDSMHGCLPVYGHLLLQVLGKWRSHCRTQQFGVSSSIRIIYVLYLHLFCILIAFFRQCFRMTGGFGFITMRNFDSTLRGLQARCDRISQAKQYRN